jgi:predicted RecA/RadA family phage recombinase
MATAIFVGEGKAIDYTPSAAVAAGDVVVEGDLIGVARTPIAAGAPGSLAVEGVFDFPKTTGAGSGIAIGTKVYWDAADKVATASTNNGATPPVPYAFLGKTVKAAADGDATVRVRLDE